MNISDQELEIFSRNLILKEFNAKSFKNLQNQKISIVGMGGIGCPASLYLVATGIKKLKVIDGDIIEKTNLNRQLLYSLKNIGESKTKIAKKKLSGINPECHITSIPYNINSTNISKYLKGSSLVIDSTDNWNTMTLINEFCVKNSIPLISSSAIGFDSQVILFKNKKNQHLCLECIFPDNDETNLPRCDTVGIIGTAAGIAGLIVAQKTINFFLGNQSNDKCITMFNTKSLKIDRLSLKKNNNCRLLKKNSTNKH